MLVTEDQMRKMLPRNSKIPEWTNLINEVCPLYNINTTRRLIMFMAHCSHESLDFTVMEENLRYSAKALERVFSKYFSRAGRNAHDYAYQPERIANIVYANRMGNGGHETGDGWRHRGLGIIQLTGKDNQSAFAAYMGMSLEKAIAFLTTMRGALHSACWFWMINGLNRYADREDVRGSTKRINGGYNGLKDRIAKYNKFDAILEKKDDTIGFRYTLRYGMQNDPEVRKMQRKLGIQVDGDFGPNTKRAVELFQRKAGLWVDGIAGPNTLGELYND